MSSVPESVWSLAPLPLLLLSLLLLLLLFAWLLYTLSLHPIANISGPRVASITRLWYVYHVRKGTWPQTNLDLHNKYGPLVRISPNEISVNDPAALPLIYSTGAKRPTKEPHFYLAWRAANADDKHPDLLTDLDETHYASRRKLLNGVYNMTSTLEAEALIDRHIELFTKQLAKHADGNRALNLGAWLPMYTFDVISGLFFGRSLGCLESGTDVQGHIAASESMARFQTTRTLLPAVYRSIHMCAALLFPEIRRGLTSFANLEVRADRLVRERESSMDEKTGEVSEGRRDIRAALEKLRIERGKAVEFDTRHVVQEGWAALTAGGDTTAILLHSIIWHILKHRSVHDTLLSELDRAYAVGVISLPIRYQDSVVKLPYLDACIKESARIHAPVGFNMPRVVPQGGLRLAGKYIPPGVAVSINAYTLHRQADVFGQNVEDFLPERWIGDSERAKRMERSLMHFGAGARSCVGKNIAMVEVRKAVATLFLMFDFELLEPDRALKSSGMAFNKPEGFDVRVARRESVVGRRR